MSVARMPRQDAKAKERRVKQGSRKPGVPLGTPKGDVGMRREMGLRDWYQGYQGLGVKGEAVGFRVKLPDCLLVVMA